MEWAPFRHTLVGICLALAMLITTWLFSAESSPLRQFALHSSIGNVIVLINMPAILLGTAFSGNAHQPSVPVTVFAMFVQWLAVGYLASWLWAKLRERPNREAADA